MPPKQQKPTDRVTVVNNTDTALEVRPWHNPDGGRQVVNPGDTFTTSAEHAAGLVSQSGGNWSFDSDKES